MTETVTEQLTDFGQLYGNYQRKEPIAQQLLQGQHRYLRELSFDPLTGEALQQRMSHWLAADTGRPEKGELQDRFTLLIDHCMDAIGQILLLPRQTVVRIHQMTPVYLAQRLDSRSVQWLSRQPGNNMREKLAANPHILAATRKMSYDTLENRLLKALLIRVEGLLLSRQESEILLTEEQQGLLESINQVLRLEEFVSIKPWQNMPPNNVLLQDKLYRKVWQAWQWLQRLEDDCQRQQDTFIASGFGLFGELLGQLARRSCCVLLDQAWQFKLDDLAVQSAQEQADSSALVKVMAIELGKGEARREARITPQAQLGCSLLSDGSIFVLRRDQSGQQLSWRLRFQHQADRQITVVITSSKGNREQGVRKTPMSAMPEDFPGLVKQLVAEILPGDSKQRRPVRPLTRASTDFATLMFEGASCTLQRGNESAVSWLAPQFIDAAGLDCSQSRALIANDQVYSAKQLSLANGDSRQLVFFAEQLASQLLVSQRMHYLVSDHHSEFETGDLRREINCNFNKATPLPKSIAAVYATFGQHQFKRNDLVMVLSSDSEGVYATPVYYRWGKKPGEEYLERHPSIRLSKQGEQWLLRSALVRAGLPESIAERFIELYSYREIASNKAPLLLQEGEHWYRVPAGLKVASIDIGDKLFQEAQALQKRADKTYFISVSAAIKPQKGVKPSQWLAGEPLSGSQRLLQRQYAEPGKIFWKDHLPQLMTRLPVNGIEQDFYFVDDQTSVKPERGVAVDIPIHTPFTLPSGQEELRFTIYQGKGSHRQLFSLLLPLRQALKTDCQCRLTLSYTYGEEQPYKLRFTPVVESKPFNYVDAQWESKQKDMENRIVAVPAFPERVAFKDLKSYQGKNGPSDIVEWIEGNLEQLAEIHRFMLHGRNSKRFNFAYRDIDWIPGKDFGFYKSHPDYASIFVHRDQFKALDITSQDYFSGDVIAKGGDKFSLVNIGKQGELTDYERKNLIKRWRFPMLTFSDQGRSFEDAELPKDFARKGKLAIEHAQELLTAVAGSDLVLEKELKQFVSYCHRLMPTAAVDNLLQAATDKFQLYSEHMRFKYALGDVSQPWQQQLLTHIFQPADDSGRTRAVTLEILSVAMWRHQAVIHQLTAAQVAALARRLNGALLSDIKRLVKRDTPIEWNAFVLRLELLLALLRTRESPAPEIRSVFAYDSELCEQLLETLEKITDKWGEALSYQLQQPKVVARVKLALNKPASYHRTPDLLYALKLYLSGEDGADQITITELVNSDQ